MVYMSGNRNTAKKTTMDSRRKRVERLKKMIIMIVIIFLLLPSILCVSLWVKVAHLENKLDRFTKAYSLKVQEENADTVYAAKVDGQDKKKDIGKDTEKDKSDSPKEQSKIKGKKVYLTFDDGPSRNTEAILDILSQNDVKATFFVIGQTDDHSKSMYQRIYDEGHTLAMHSYCHQYDKIYKSVGAFSRDMDKLKDYLLDLTGYEPKFIRFPGGSSNTVCKIGMEPFIQYANEQGYVYFDWNVINGDATGQKLTNKQMVHNVISGVKNYENSVVLMHDCVGKEQTVETLPVVLKKLKKMNVTLLPIDETTVPVQHVKAK